MVVNTGLYFLTILKIKKNGTLFIFSVPLELCTILYPSSFFWRYTFMELHIDLSLYVSYSFNPDFVIKN